jgi:hypothetical protein
LYSGCCPHPPGRQSLWQFRSAGIERGTALGRLGPLRAGGAVEGGEVIDGGGEDGHGFLLWAPFCQLKRISKAGNGVDYGPFTS